LPDPFISRLDSTHELLSEIRDLLRDWLMSPDVDIGRHIDVVFRGRGAALA